MYVDPDGEIAWIIGAVIGGFLNATIAALNDGNVGRAFITGAISGGLGGAVGTGVGSLLPSTASSGFIGGAITGAAGGFVGGSTNAWLNGANLSEGFVSGLIGAGSGALIGGLIRGVSDVSKGFNFWNGSKIGGELSSTSPASGQTYDKTTLKRMAVQAKLDAEYLWDIKTGKNGLIDISTTLDAGAKGRGYTYKNGSFVNSSGQNVDGFTTSYSNGNSNVFISPDAAASRTGAFPSGYSMITGSVGDLQVANLSARYVSTLGHELIHVENWFNGGYSNSLYTKYSENAAYEFSKHVWRGDANMVRAIDHIMKTNSWTTSYPAFRKTSIIY